MVTNDVVSLCFQKIKEKEMKSISIIVAIDLNNAIGKKNHLLCHLPNDLQYFKQKTTGHSIIMGRKTFESLPNGALPNRRNIVLSKNTNLNIKNFELANSLQQAIDMCKGNDEVFIIGGASLYNEAIKFAHKLYVTLIHHKFEGADTFFPTIDTDIWQNVTVIKNLRNENNIYDHDFIVFERKDKS